MQNAKLNDSLNECVKKHAAEKLFDHLYFETGHLNKPQSAALIYRWNLESENIFDLASVTKALVTTPLIFDALTKGKLKSLDATLEEWLGPQKTSDFGQDTKKIKVSDLLKHEAGLAFWANFFSKCSATQKTQNVLEAINRAASESKNRGRSVYGDLNFILLGMCLERSSGKMLSDLFAEFFPFSPTFGTRDQIEKQKCVSTGYSSIRGRELIGEVNDENVAASLNSFAGHSGLFATGEKVSEYLRFLWNSQTGKNLIQKNAELIETNLSNERLMGLRQGGDFSANVFGKGMTMGHYGFTGTTFWLEPKSSAYVILLTNRVKFFYAPTQPWREFRKQILEIANEITFGK